MPTTPHQLQLTNYSNPVPLSSLGHPKFPFFWGTFVPHCWELNTKASGVSSHVWERPQSVGLCGDTRPVPSHRAKVPP